MRRTGTFVAVLLTVAVLALAAVVVVLQVWKTPTPGPERTRDQRRIALGVDLAPDRETAAGLRGTEQTIGHKLTFTRRFLLWNSPFPTSFDGLLARNDTTVALSVRPKRTDGTNIPWRDIADARPGSALYAQIVGWADRLRRYGQSMFFTFNHEPEAMINDKLGSASDYVAAWRHIHDVFADQGATNVRFLSITTSYAFDVSPKDRRYGPKWYPGDAYVDAIGADAYNFGTCRFPNAPWQNLAPAIAGFVRFGARHRSKPLYLPEFGTVEDRAVPGRKAQWFVDAQALLKKPAYRQIVGVAYFDLIEDGFPQCEFPWTSSATATTAFRTLAHDRYFSGTVGFG